MAQVLDAPSLPAATNSNGFQKATKQLAARNVAILNRLHLISLFLNSLFIILQFLIFRASVTRNTYLLYLILSAPAFVIEFWFENIGRPKYGQGGEVKRAGEDLEAKGLTEYMFDVLYWTWGTLAVSAVVGNKGWWLWTVVPVYSIWLAYTTFGSVRQGMAGLSGQGDEGTAMSNRQKKMEKRGGQKVQYR